MKYNLVGQKLYENLFLSEDFELYSNQIFIIKLFDKSGENRIIEYCNKPPLKNICLSFIHTPTNTPYNRFWFRNLEYLENLELTANCEIEVAYCPNLRNIFIPKYSEILLNSISSNSSIENFFVETGHELYASVDGILFSSNLEILLSFPKKITGDYIIPRYVKEIATNAFTNSILESVVIPSSVIIIKANAFEECKQLKSVDLSQFTGIIESNAFSKCKNLIQIKFPNACSISEGCFRDCDSLMQIDIPSNVHNIEKCAFKGCLKLNIIYGYENVVEIGESAFENCIELKNFEFKPNIKILHKYAFCGCSNIKSLYLPKTLEKINYWTFAKLNLDNLKLDVDISSLYEEFFHESKIQSVIYPNHVHRLPLWLSNRKKCKLHSRPYNLSYFLGYVKNIDKKNNIVSVVGNREIIKYSKTSNQEFKKGDLVLYYDEPSIIQHSLGDYSISSIDYNYVSILKILTFKTEENIILYGTDYSKPSTFLNKADFLKDIITPSVESNYLFNHIDNSVFIEQFKSKHCISKLLLITLLIEKKFAEIERLVENYVNKIDINKLINNYTIDIIEDFQYRVGRDDVYTCSECSKFENSEYDLYLCSILPSYNNEIIRETGYTSAEKMALDEKTLLELKQNAKIKEKDFKENAFKNYNKTNHIDYNFNRIMDDYLEINNNIDTLVEFFWSYKRLTI